MTEPEQTRKNAGIIPGLALLGCQAVGAIGLLGGIVGLIYLNFLGAGVCLIAAALAFGIVAFISFSD